MKKSIFISVLSLMLCIVCIVSVRADSYSSHGDPDLLIDVADKLTDYEEENLRSVLSEVSDRHSVSVSCIILPYTMNEKGQYIGMTEEACANLFFDEFGYGYGDGDDGVLFLIVTDTRGWYVTSVGYASYAITEAGYDYIEIDVIPYLSEGDYSGAIARYAEICDELIGLAKSGNPYTYDYGYDDDYYYDDYYDTAGDPLSAEWIGVCLLLGVILAVVIVLVMASKNKSVHKENAAHSYIRPGSMNVTVSRDQFLYRNVIKHRKSNSSSSGSRSGGSRSSGGGGGRSGRGGRF